MNNTATATALLDLKGVRKTFRTPERHERTVLEGVDFRLEEGEIVALLGKSGSGKSTLLRIMAGLIPANGGDVMYRGQSMTGPARGIAMVFQSFALFPWLTVQDNVELGLEAAGVGVVHRSTTLTGCSTWRCQFTPKTRSARNIKCMPAATARPRTKDPGTARCWTRKSRR